MSNQYQLTNRSFGRRGLSVMLGLGVAFIASLVVAPSQTNALYVPGCTFNYSAESTTWELMGDCEVSSTIHVPQAGITIDGNGYTIRTATGMSDFAVISNFGADNMTIRDLTIDSAGSFVYFGIVLNTTKDVQLINVTSNNNLGSTGQGAGIYIYESTVTATNLSTSGNYAGVIVDIGLGVSSPAVLTVLGTSSHADTNAHIYVDDTAKSVVINDVNNQYTSMTDVYNKGDAIIDEVYTLKPLAPLVSQCKDGGWVFLKNADGTLFKNQGECVSFVVANDNAHFKR